MATNPYILNYNSNEEQDLIEGITIEIIQAMGQDCIYVPRNYFSIDKIFGEDPASAFTRAFTLEMYLVNFRAFDGTDVITQFGLEIKDKATLLFSRKRFNEEITYRAPDITRPREGDLIYFPLSKSLFEINFVEHENPLYVAGRLYSYQVTAELFTYSYENVSTDNSTIDSIVTRTRGYSGSEIIPLNINLGTTAGINDTLKTEGAGYTFDPNNPFEVEDCT